jgi:hypothetical protein
MTRDADFPKDVVDRLAKSAGYVCSWPDCDNPTVGPSSEGVGATTSVGMACHIVAASGGPGARRVVPGMPAAERADYTNGIWMCYTHGKQIDTDETRFSIEMLRRWRELAELRARIRLESSGTKDLTRAALLHFELVSNAIALPRIGTENILIGDALHDSLVQHIWGKDIADSVRDFAIEIARNAFDHGGATEFVLDVTQREMRLTDNGRPFDTLGMSPKTGRGGARALHELRLLAGERIILSSSRVDGTNVTRLAFVRTANDALELSACSLFVDHAVLHERSRVERLSSCDKIYIVLPRYTSISDAYMLEIALPVLAPGASYVFVVSRTSRVVQRIIAELFQGAAIVSVD